MNTGKHVLALSLLVVTLVGCQSNPQKTVKDQTTQLEEQIALADRLLTSGKFEASLAEYHLALELDRSNLHVLSQLAYLYDRMGDTTATEYALRDLLAVNPDHPEALERLGLLELRNGQRADAGEKLSRAETLGQTSWRLFNGLGVLADYNGDHPAAQAYYASALQQQGANRSLILNNIGYSYYLSGDPQRALRQFDQSLAIAPEFDQALSNKGLTLVRIGRSDDAYRVFRSFMSEEKALNNIGFLQMLFGNYQVAEQYLKMAIKASPVYYEEAHQNLDHIDNLRRNRTPTDSPG